MVEVLKKIIVARVKSGKYRVYQECVTHTSATRVHPVGEDMDSLDEALLYAHSLTTSFYDVPVYGPHTVQGRYTAPLNDRYPD